jgi:hypothetical protein
MPVSPELSLKPEVLVPGHGATCAVGADAVSGDGNAASGHNFTHPASGSVLAPA